MAATVGNGSHNGREDIIRIGCRPSVLAKIQAQLVLDQLTTLFPSHTFEISAKAIYTAGDRDKNRPLRSLNAVSLWTLELEEALLGGELDILVHSLKDVPTKVMDGCEITPVLPREDHRDCLVVKKDLPYRSLEELPAGSIVGTGSVRRVAQLKRRYPSLVFQDVRGNIGTRLDKLDAPSSPYAALILASAGLLRLDLSDRITTYLSPPTAYPAVGQGSLGAEFRSSDLKIKDMISQLEDRTSGWLVRAERALLGVLEGGCSVPVGIWSTCEDSDPNSPSTTVKLVAVLTSPDGAEEVSLESSGTLSSAEDAVSFGKSAALTLLERGGREIMEKLAAKPDPSI